LLIGWESLENSISRYTTTAGWPGVRAAIGNLSFSDHTTNSRKVAEMMAMALAKLDVPYVLIQSRQMV
jgi:hypothetical protein